MQNCHVELMPGSGVFVSSQFYANCLEQPVTDGSRLIRKLVREVFTDEEILSGFPCTGDMQLCPGTKEPLDRRKVCIIEGMLIHSLDIKLV